MDNSIVLYLLPDTVDYDTVADTETSYTSIETLDGGLIGETENAGNRTVVDNDVN